MLTSDFDKMKHIYDKNLEGGAALVKPKVQIGQKAATVTKSKNKSANKQKERTDENARRREDDFEDAPMFNIILAGDMEDEQANIVQRLTDFWATWTRVMPPRSSAPPASDFPLRLSSPSTSSQNISRSS